jgi:hypothetical protein
LNRGAIPPRAFVWRQGWGEWLRAAEVQELSHAVPLAARATSVMPKLSPDATHPPPVPKEGGQVMLEPIVPVASTPENDKPGTQLMVDVELELDVEDLQALSPVPAPPSRRTPPPPRRSSAPPPPSMRSAPPRPASVKPITPAISGPSNDKPTTDLVPPADKWQDVAKLEPIKPVESSPNNPEVTGLIGDEEIQLIEGAAGPTAKGLPKSDTLKFGAMPAAPPAPSVPSLDKLGDAIEAKRPPRPSPIIAVNAPAPAPVPVVPEPVTPAPAAYAPPHAPQPPLHKQTVMGLSPQPAAMQPAPITTAPTPAPAPPAFSPKSTMMGIAPVPPAAMQPAAAQPPAPPPPAPPSQLKKTVMGMAPMPPMAMSPALPPIVPDADPDSEGPTRLVDPIVPVSEPENDAPTQVQMSPMGEAAPLPSWEVEESPQEWPATPPPPRAQQYSQASYGSYHPPKKSSLPLVLGAFGLLALVAVGGGGALLYFKPWQKAEPKPVATVAPAAATETKPVVARCVVEKEARRVSSSMVVSTPAYVTTSPTSASKLAIGFAESEAVGIGVTLDPATLDFEQAFKSPAGAKVVGVSPIKGTPGFAVDRENAALGMPHTINGSTPFVVGFSPTGYSRQVGTGQPELVWSEVARDKATELRVASAEGTGHALSFRNANVIRIGWLKPDGSKLTSLGTIDAGSARVGNPSIGQNGKNILVAFAAKEGESAWTIQLASSKVGELPSKSKTFSIPAGGPGGDTIAPVVGGLSNGRWLVQWTEGGAGERTVRAVTLNDSLEPVGEPLRISAPGKEAGQGEIGVVGENAAAFHLVKADKGYELWATALSCK